MRLTKNLLKKIIEEEVSKFGDMEDVEKVKADEVDADEYADSLEKKLDFIKALKIEEARLRRRLERIIETRRRVVKKS